MIHKSRDFFVIFFKYLKKFKIIDFKDYFYYLKDYNVEDILIKDMVKVSNSKPVFIKKLIENNFKVTQSKNLEYSSFIKAVFKNRNLKAPESIDMLQISMY